MGFCSRRYFFLSICLLQMISVIQREVFDFLGFLWIPILVNFFEIIFIILGFFGAYQYRPKYIISYILWHLFWLAWNVFIICLYLDVAGLDHKTNKVLKLDSKSESWWNNEGPGCKKIVPLADEPWNANVENCFINYVHVEVFQAGLQCFLSFLGILIGICVCRLFLEEDDTSSRKSSSSRKNNKRMSLYSIEFSSQIENRHVGVSSGIGSVGIGGVTTGVGGIGGCGDSDSNDFDNEPQPPVSPKPMTPRRVKRRSVMTRGTSGRHSTSSSNSRRHSARSSTRSSRRTAQNPVTRLLEQQQQQQQLQQQQQQQQHHHQQQQQHTIQNSYDSPASPSPIESLPNYYNSVSNTNLMVISSHHHQSWQSNGHSNPTYQQSSTQSLNETDDFDELYNNRPASVRSSYSNFHGTRAINYNTTPTKQHHYHHSHATPQVPQKRNNSSSRNSMRSIAFLNNGPPAYTSSQGQASFDSETTI